MSGYLELCMLGDLLVRGSEHHPERGRAGIAGGPAQLPGAGGPATEVARSLTAMGVTLGDRVGPLRLREQLEAELEARRMP